MELNDKWDWVDTSSKNYSNAINEILNTENNLLILGAGGTGKSILLKVAYDHFTNVLVMGPTGISAANLATDQVPATTIHSALKIPPVSVFSKVNISVQALDLVTKSRLILIDEISMVNASLMDFILRVVKSSLYKIKPRIIVFGDIFQLPPVRSDDDEVVSNYFDRQFDGNYFFFNSRLYKKMKFKTISLNEIFRQKDPLFKETLNRIRLGIQTDEDLELINSRVVSDKKKFMKDNPLSLYLATTNKTVTRLNKEYTSRKEFTKRETYTANISGSFDIRSHPSLEEKITIAVGQQVMCTGNNQEAGYQNGTLGLVVEVFPSHVIVKKSDGVEVKVLTQTWEKYQYFVSPNTDEVMHKVVGACTQIACKPAFAVTFHKCQGLTLDSIYVDLNSWFVPVSGVYLALSRCKTLEGIGLSRPITHDDIKVSPEALEFIAESMD